MKELSPFLQENVFNAPKQKAPHGHPKSKRAKAAPSSPRVPKGPKKRDPSASERALEGQEFEDDRTDWKVLSVRGAMKWRGLWCGTTTMKMQAAKM
jgi:hypothetical protein